MIRFRVSRVPLLGLRPLILIVALITSGIASAQWEGGWENQKVTGLWAAPGLLLESAKRHGPGHPRL